MYSYAMGGEKLTLQISLSNTVVAVGIFDSVATRELGKVDGKMDENSINSLLEIHFPTG